MSEIGKNCPQNLTSVPSRGTNTLYYYAGACRKFLSTAEQILNHRSGVKKNSGVDVSEAEMANIRIKTLILQVFRIGNTA